MDEKKIDELIKSVDKNSQDLKNHIKHVDASFIRVEAFSKSVEAFREDVNGFIKKADTTFTNIHNNFVLTAKNEQMVDKQINGIYKTIDANDKQINAIYKTIDATDRHINAVIYGRHTTRWVVSIALALASGFLANYIASLL